MKNYIINLLNSILDKLNLIQADPSVKPETSKELADLREEVKDLNDLIIKDEKGDVRFKYLNLTISIFPTVAAIAMILYVFYLKGKVELDKRDLTRTIELKDSVIYYNNKIIEIQDSLHNEARLKDVDIRQKYPLAYPEGVLVIPQNHFLNGAKWIEGYQSEIQVLLNEIKAREYARTLLKD